MSRVASVTSEQPRATAVATVDAPLPIDLARVHVVLGGRGRRRVLGSALTARADARLTTAERTAIDAVVRAVQLLRERAGLAGIDDAGRAVTLVLRDTEADSGGPWATNGELAVGSRNALMDMVGDAARPSTLLTVDVAVHELTHVVQFARMPAGAKPHGALLEGIADTAAALATGDDTLGEGFYRRDAAGRPRGAVRELGAPRVAGPNLGEVDRRYEDAIRRNEEPHQAGGLVSATFFAIRATLGRERAEQLLWWVIRDTTAWKSGGSWKELALALRRGAAALWPGDSLGSSTVEQALLGTGLARAAA